MDDELRHISKLNDIYDKFFEFAIIWVKEYHKSLESENIPDNKKDKDEGIFINHNPKLQEQII